MDVNALLTSPLAKGLFHRAIAESGTASRVPDDATVRMTGLATTMAPRSGGTYSDALTLREAERAGAKLSATPRSLAPTIPRTPPRPRRRSLTDTSFAAITIRTAPASFTWAGKLPTSREAPVGSIGRSERWKNASRKSCRH